MQPPYQHSHKIEPTQAAHLSHPYETTERPPAYLNPYLNDQYQDVPPIPPPPPKHKNYRWLYALLLVVASITPVTIYRIIYPAVPVIVTAYHTLVVTPTPYPTFKVSDPGLYMNEVSGTQMWGCTLANHDNPGGDLTNITLENHSPNITVYECERAENAFPNTHAAGYETIKGNFPDWCKGVMKDGTIWSATAEYSPDVLPECKILSSW